MIYVTSGYASGAAYPMAHARILWDNVLAGATFTATDARDGFAADRARSPDTVSWWWPSVAATLTMTLPAAAEIDCVGIAAHKIGSTNSALLLEGLIGGVWTALHPEIEPADDEAIMILFAPVTVTAIRISLDIAARVGVVYAGPALTMPQMVYGQAPILRLTSATEYDTNRSQTGQFMGRSVVSSARPFRATWTHLLEAWTRTTLAEFIAAAKLDPFFIALRPGGYPDDVGYVLAGDDIIPERMSLKSYTQVQIRGEAHVEPKA